jgi:hypothetical protein
MSTTISDGTTDVTSNSSGSSINTVSGLPTIDGSAYSTRGIPLSEYSTPNKSSIDLVGLRGPQGKKGDVGATGARGARWIPLALDQTSKITSIVAQIASISDVLKGDYVLDTVSSDVFVLTTLITPEYITNIKGKKSDIITSVQQILIQNYTLQSSDASTMLSATYSSASTSIVLPNDSVPIDIGATVFFIQQTIRPILFVEGDGVSIVTSYKKETRKNGSVAIATKIGSNKWALFGDLKYIDMDKVIDVSNVSYSGVSPVLIFENALI